MTKEEFRAKIVLDVLKINYDKGIRPEYHQEGELFDHANSMADLYEDMYGENSFTKRNKKGENQKIGIYWGLISLFIGFSMTYIKFSEMIGADKNKTLDFASLFLFVYTFFMGVGLIYNYYKNKN